jgi:hypothetical protein
LERIELFPPTPQGVAHRLLRSGTRAARRRLLSAASTTSMVFAPLVRRLERV